jgi:hypothetical protein
MMNAAADSEFFEDRWLDNGGIQTLESYGLRAAAAIPEDHVNWLQRLPLAAAVFEPDDIGPKRFTVVK